LDGKNAKMFCYNPTKAGRETAKIKTGGKTIKMGTMCYMPLKILAGILQNDVFGGKTQKLCARSFFQIAKSTQVMEKGLPEIVHRSFASGNMISF